jgi:hypothetical protein
MEKQLNFKAFGVFIAYWLFDSLILDFWGALKLSQNSLNLLFKSHKFNKTI